MVALIYLVLSGGVIGMSLTIAVVFGYRYLIKWWYPIHIPIVIQRGKTFQWATDRGKYTKQKDGKEYIGMWKARKKIKPAQFEYVNVDKRGKPVYPLFNTSVGQYWPIKLSNVPKTGHRWIKKFYDEEGNLKNKAEMYSPLKMINKIQLESVEDKGAMNWAIQQLAENEARYMPSEGWMSILVKYVAPISFAIMVIFWTIFMGMKMEITANSLNGAATQLALAMERFAQAPPPPPAG